MLKKKIEIHVYEPLLNEVNTDGVRLVNDLNEFKNISEIIIKQISPELEDKNKVYCRDIFRTIKFPLNSLLVDQLPLEKSHQH